MGISKETLDEMDRLWAILANAGNRDYHDAMTKFNMLCGLKWPTIRDVLRKVEEDRVSKIDAIAWQPIENLGDDTKWRCWHCHAIVYRNCYPTTGGHTEACPRYDQ